MDRSTKIFARGSLAKFLDARERGASRDELTKLSAEAMRESAVGTSHRKKVNDNRQRHIVDLDAERAKRAAEWDSALD